MSELSMTADNLVIKQAQFHSDAVCKEILSECENKYLFEDETKVFSDLVNFSTAKNQPYQRWVRYREGYSTILVKELITRSQIDPQKMFIADPMMGSGSTLVAAKSIGYDTLGMDVNPYCEMITNLKLASPADGELLELLKLVEEKPWICMTLSEDDNPPLSDYFPEKNLAEVLKLRNWIETIPESFIKSSLTAAWFFCLENSSNRKKDGNGLATRPAPVNDVSAYFCDIVRYIVEDFRSHPLEDNRNYVRTCSALEFSKHVKDCEEVFDKKLGCVIFSPPYANSFDYFESYKLELLFGGLICQEDFSERKKDLIRNYRLSNKHIISCDIDIADALCREIINEIPKKEAKTGKRDGRTRLTPNMIRGYFTDMDKVLKEIYKALSSGGTCYIVVDQSAYVGVIISTDTILALLAERTGLVVDKILVCRKAATSGQQLKQYPYLKSTLRESIVCLRKP